METTGARLSGTAEGAEKATGALSGLSKISKETGSSFKSFVSSINNATHSLGNFGKSVQFLLNPLQKLGESLSTVIDRFDRTNDLAIQYGDSMKSSFGKAQKAAYDYGISFNEITAGQDVFLERITTTAEEVNKYTDTFGKLHRATNIGTTALGQLEFLRPLAAEKE